MTPDQAKAIEPAHQRTGLKRPQPCKSASRRFSEFACIDWSGARGERQKGIALAVVGAEGAPQLIERQGGWSRTAILDWLLDQARIGRDMLIGVDFSASLPFFDSNAFFPGMAESPSDARALWAWVDELCAADAHFGVDSFVDHPELSRYFRRHGGRQGDLFDPAGNGRLRLVERLCRENGHGPSVSGFNLVGAAQVGKSTLSGMRILSRLNGIVALWPFDPLPPAGPVLVETYTTIAARRAGLKGGSKMRDAERLAIGLRGLGVAGVPRLARYDDHSTDAILTAAWLRIAAQDDGLWHPQGMKADVIAREGWTFGVP